MPHVPSEAAAGPSSSAIGMEQRKFGRAPVVSAALVAVGCCLFSPFSVADHATQNVVLIVSDGLRWQEVFSGADASLLNDEHGGIWEPADSLKARFWNDDPAVRRRVLLPFLWDVIAKQGQLYGNQAKGSVARVTNPYWFSYPGYNEM